MRCYFAVALLLAVAASARSVDIKYRMASKTPYYPLQSFGDHTAPPAGCEPIHLSLVARHGTRNPGDSDIEAFDRLERKIAQYAADIRPECDWLLAYKNPFLWEDQSKLIDLGRQEHYDMARRFKAAYPSLFEPAYDTDLYMHRSTQEQRAGLSAASFGYGLFEGRGSLGADAYEPVFVYSETEALDNVLQYYDNCPRYIDEVGDNATANIETEIYLAAILDDIAANLSRKLTVNGAWRVTPDEAFEMYAACQFDVTLFDKYDEWCLLFSLDEIEQFEYAEDLDDYYTKAYPYDINYQMATELIKDVVAGLQGARAGTSRQRASLRFAHSSTVVPLVSVFGLYRDDALLRADSPADVVAHRRFRTSIVSPMGTNFAFVLYDCAQGDALVKVLHSEMEVVVDGCDHVYCPLDTFIGAYEWYLTTPFEDVCGVDWAVAA